MHFEHATIQLSTPCRTLAPGSSEDLDCIFCRSDDSTLFAISLSRNEVVRELQCPNSTSPQPWCGGRALAAKSDSLVLITASGEEVSLKEQEGTTSKGMCNIVSLSIRSPYVAVQWQEVAGSDAANVSALILQGEVFLHVGTVTITGLSHVLVSNANHGAGTLVLTSLEKKMLTVRQMSITSSALLEIASSSFNVGTLKMSDVKCCISDGGNGWVVVAGLRVLRSDGVERRLDSCKGLPKSSRPVAVAYGEGMEVVVLCGTSMCWTFVQLSKSGEIHILFTFSRPPEKQSVGHCPSLVVCIGGYVCALTNPDTVTILVAKEPSTNQLQREAPLASPRAPLAERLTKRLAPHSVSLLVEQNRLREAALQCMRDGSSGKSTSVVLRDALFAHNGTHEVLEVLMAETEQDWVRKLCDYLRCVTGVTPATIYFALKLCMQRCSGQVDLTNSVAYFCSALRSLLITTSFDYKSLRDAAQRSNVKSLGALKILYLSCLHLLSIGALQCASLCGLLVDALLQAREEKESDAAKEGVEDMIHNIHTVLTMLARWSLDEAGPMIGQWTAHCGPTCPAVKEAMFVPRKGYNIHTATSLQISASTISLPC